jgi:hypothetical protein
VDLDIISRSSLERLASAMGSQAFVLYVGAHGRTYRARLELAVFHRGMSADRTIAGLVRIVERLPRVQRRLWDAAVSREFNIGIEAGLQPHCFELRLKPSTVQSVGRIGATLAVTVYAPDGGADAALSAFAKSRSTRGPSGSTKRTRKPRFKAA